MIQVIFPNQFYYSITSPNKKELVDGIKNAKVDKIRSSTITWNSICGVEVQSLYPNEILPLLYPSLELFFKDLEIDKKIVMTDVWRNTYKRGTFQDIHSHVSDKLNSNPFNDLSGCVFLEDSRDDFGSFYFFNRYADLSPPWKEIFQNKGLDCTSISVNYKAGDVIFFPSSMLHGVTVQQSQNLRRTLSFNISFLP
tara:strand:+ start:294 stop:881 length:588 start_codon:yes stop_codon:yes gene_type:complete